MVFQCAKHDARHFTPLSFSPHNYPLNYVPSVSSFTVLQMGIQGSERLSNMPSVTQLRREKVELEPVFLHVGTERKKRASKC